MATLRSRLEYYLGICDQHIAQARDSIARQRLTINRLSENGHGTGLTDKFLLRLLTSQQLHEDHRAHLLKEIDLCVDWASIHLAARLAGLLFRQLVLMETPAHLVGACYLVWVDKRGMLLEHLALAEKHIVEGEIIVAAQRERVRQLKDAGKDASESEILLESFLDIQRMSEAHRARILAELSELEP